MSLELVPGGRVPLPRNQLLRVILAWDAPRPFKLIRSCVSMDAAGRIVDVLNDIKFATRDRAVLVEDDNYVLDLQEDTGLTYVFSLHAEPGERLEALKVMNFVVVDQNADVFAKYNKACNFGYKSVALGAINYRKEWRVRALGIASHAATVLEMLPEIKAGI